MTIAFSHDRRRMRIALGRRRSRGRTERAHRSLENRTDRGFPQRPHASSIERSRKKRLYLHRLTHEIPDTPEELSGLRL
jgi:hypothetical protein